jgi:hypothetical protein
MNEIDQLNKVKIILNQILSKSSLHKPNYVVQEAKNHIKQAISKLEKATKKEAVKKIDNSKTQQQWVNDINSYYKIGTVGLQKVEAMIKAEKDKLDELEKKSQTIDNNDDDMILD